MRNSVFNFKGSDITFISNSDKITVNATEMAKPFSKQTQDWTRLKYTAEFINTYSDAKGIPVAELLVIQNGVGTWMHEDVALEFARWLSPSFAIWCNDRVKELMKHGFTATDKTLDDLIGNPDLVISLATQLKEERLEKDRLKVVADQQSKELSLQAPKVLYFDEVMTSSSTYTTTLIAKELGMSAIELNRKLYAFGVQYKQNNTWVLYSKHQSKGYTKTSTYTYTNTTGQTESKMQTEWTEKGRKFIHDLLKPSNLN